MDVKWLLSKWLLKSFMQRNNSMLSILPNKKLTNFFLAYKQKTLTIELPVLCIVVNLFNKMIYHFTHIYSQHRSSIISWRLNDYIGLKIGMQLIILSRLYDCKIRLSTLYKERILAGNKFIIPNSFQDETFISFVSTCSNLSF